jgi:hypothetical protein
MSYQEILKLLDAGYTKDEIFALTRADNPDKPDKPNNPEKPDKPNNPEKPDKPNNLEKPDKPDKPDKPNNPEKPDKPSIDLDALAGKLVDKLQEYNRRRDNGAGENSTVDDILASIINPHKKGDK